MSEEQQPSDDGHTPVSRAQKDDVYLVPGIVILFALSSLRYVFDLEIEDIVVAVMLATAVSMVVYRFLGGIESATEFKLGAIKFGGSLAAFAGLFFMLNSEFKESAGTLDAVFPKKADTPFVFVNARTAEPMDIVYRLRGIEDTVRQNPSMFDKNGLDIQPEGIVVSSDGRHLPIGTLDKQDLEQLDEHLEQSNPFGPMTVLEKRVYNNTRSQLVNSTPFILTITGMNQGATSFYLTSAKDPDFKWEKTFSGHTADIVTLKGEPYMVLVYSFIHPSNNKDSCWSRFAFCPMNLDIAVDFPNSKETQ